MKFIFKENNNIPYFQDLQIKINISENVEFDVEVWYASKKDKRYRLHAYGYGDLARKGGYGNGIIGIFAKDLRNKKYLYIRRNK